MASSPVAGTKLGREKPGFVGQRDGLPPVEDELSSLIVGIIEQYDENGTPMITKYDRGYIIDMLDGEKMKKLEEKFEDFDVKGVDIIDFVKIFLSVIEHTENETLFLIVGLIDIFKEISENIGMATYVKINDFSSYIVDILTEKNVGTYKIPTKRLPDTKKFNIDPSRVREIDINAPIMYGETNHGLQRVSNQKLKTDSVHHNNHSIKAAAYASDIGRIFTLDTLSDNIAMYTLQPLLLKRIHPKLNGKPKDSIIMNFAWSGRQQRIGACLKDFTISFWEANDNFDFEKVMNVSTTTIINYQTNIWYVDYLNTWITTDHDHGIHFWDLESEVCKFSLRGGNIHNEIIDVCEITYIKCIAVSSLDKKIFIFNTTKQRLLFEIPLSQGGVHSLVFSDTYQLMLSAGYENVINLWTIDPKYFDHTNEGKLIGHISMVTAIQVIEKTPLCVSADDNGILKIWDIRKLSCLQTISLGSRTIITTILDLHDVGKLSFVGSRINILEFDDIHTMLKRAKRDDLYAIRAEYNFLLHELVVCTRKDVRFIDLANGRTKKYLSALVSDQDDITTFRIVEASKKFIVGDMRGALTIFSYNSGEMIKELGHHPAEVSQIIIDHHNRLFLSAAVDSSILLQKETKTGSSETLRSITNEHHGKEITILELSVHHNIFVTSSTSNVIYLYDYEFFKLVTEIRLLPHQEPTAIKFINGAGILIVATNVGVIYFFQLELNKDLTNIQIRLIGILHLDYSPGSKVDSFPKQASAGPNGSYKDIMKTIPSKLGGSQRLLITQPIDKKPGDVDELDDDDLAVFFNPPPNFNTLGGRKSSELLTDSTTFATKLFVDMTYTEPEEQNGDNSPQGVRTTIKPIECTLYAATNRGTLKSYNLSRLFSLHQLPFIPTSTIRVNYNAYRKAKENFNTMIEHIKFNSFVVADILANVSALRRVVLLNKDCVLSFQAHREPLNSLEIINVPDKCILTTSADCYVKLWNPESGTVLCSVNLNHPLPIKWGISSDHSKIHQKKILYALKIIETIFLRYKTVMLYSEEKLYAIDGFLRRIREAKTQDGQNPADGMFPKISNKKTPDQYKITVMKDEYDPRDIQYEAIKKLYQEEIQGPSLKQLEASRRMLQAQAAWKSESIEEKNPEKFTSNGKKKLFDGYAKDFLNFFADETDTYESRIAKIMKKEPSPAVKSLSEKLDLTLAMRDDILDNTLNPRRSVPRKSFHEIQDVAEQTKVSKSVSKINFPSVDARQAKKIAAEGRKPLSIKDKDPGSNPIESKAHSQAGDSPIHRIRSEIGLQVSKQQQGSTSKLGGINGDFLSYAMKKNLVDLTTTTNHSDSTILPAVENRMERKLRFHEMMVNMDKKIKKSQLTFASPRSNKQLQNSLVSVHLNLSKTTVNNSTLSKSVSTDAIRKIGQQQMSAYAPPRKNKRGKDDFGFGRGFDGPDVGAKNSNPNQDEMMERNRRIREEVENIANKIRQNVAGLREKDSKSVVNQAANNNPDASGNELNQGTQSKDHLTTRKGSVVLNESGEEQIVYQEGDMRQVEHLFKAATKKFK